MQNHISEEKREKEHSIVQKNTLRAGLIEDVFISISIHSELKSLHKTKCI